MVTKLDKQLEEYDTHVGSSLQFIACNAIGRIPIRDLAKALSMIRHRPEEYVVAHVAAKLDVDHDSYVELEHWTLSWVITSVSLGRVARHLVWVVESVEAILVLVAMTVTGSGSETVMEDGLGMRAILSQIFVLANYFYFLQ
jgi:hypothetical protein